MRYLAIDYGKKRTGLAICDKSEMLASPLLVIETSRDIFQKISQIAEKENVECIIIGLPLNMDDTEGPAAKAVRDFAAQLAKQIDISIVFHDERLSSFSANHKLREMDITRKKKDRRRDAIAAAAILESFLEKKRQIISPQ